MQLIRSGSWLLNLAFASVPIVLCLSSASLQAGGATTDSKALAPTDSTAVGTVVASEQPVSRATIRKLTEKETADTDLPPDIAEAVVFVESGYDTTVVGGVGELGLMQVRPETAAMLGFHGTHAELAQPDVNIHYGVLYLTRAWRLAGGDLCRALMKYRAGHGEEMMTPRSQVYCSRAHTRLLAVNSASASQAAAPPVAATPSSRPTAKARPSAPAPGPRDGYATYRQGTAAASRAFWAAHEARIGLINARIEARWKRMASR